MKKPENESPEGKNDRKALVKVRLKDIEIGMSSAEIVLRISIGLALIGYGIYALITNDFYSPPGRFVSKGRHYHDISAVYWVACVFFLALASMFDVFRFFCWRKKICQRWVNYKFEIVLIVLAFVFEILA